MKYGFKILVLFCLHALMIGPAVAQDKILAPASVLANCTRRFHGQRYKRSVETEVLHEKSRGEDKDPYLSLTEEMQNQTLLSGERAHFRCKVDGYPMKNLTFTWYKDGVKMVESEELRVRIKDKSWGSRLQINDVYSTDSGKYRCEASNVFRRVQTSAYLKVSFIPLPDVPDHSVNDDFLKGKCEVYQGLACSEYMKSISIYLESFQTQSTMEQKVIQALQFIGDIPDISVKCRSHATKAFCYYVFPPCITKNGFPTKERQPAPLCREDCDLLKYDICRKEFFQQTSDNFISAALSQTDCSPLPATSTSSSQCTGIGLPSVINRSHKCYNESGETYKGTLSVTVNGNTCQQWPTSMLYKYPQLSGGHNFCRNPGGSEVSPWCYTDRKNTVKESCQVPLCNFKQNSNLDLVMVIIPAVSVPLLLGCFVFMFCFACKKKKKTFQHTKGIKLERNTLSVKKAKVPQLNSNLIHFGSTIGDGKYGKVYTAQILSNLHYCPNEPVAIKKLSERPPPEQVQDFQREIEMFSALQHANITCMKAIVVQSPLRCMVFEYSSGTDLHEHLVMHSPLAGFAKPPSNGSSHASFVIEHADFIRMGIQISAGMEYLISRNFIHRDLAARNVLVYRNMELKICNLGVIRDSHLSSYYRSPQGGQMLPIRWMAPESLQNWQFSDKSAVWSFGVLVWEMYSYGLQPYCGYSNHEVLDMISRRKLLPCPEQCPAKMYSLINECWSFEANLRPLFKDIHTKLIGWEGTSTTRMTSQLAQGIHRQLNEVMKNGTTGQYVQYNGSEHKTMLDEMHRPNHSLNISPIPPQLFYPARTQNLAPILSENSYNATAYSGHAANNSNPLQLFAHQENCDSYPHSETTHSPPTIMCPSYYSSDPSRSSGSITSTEHHHQLHRLNNLGTHNQIQEPIEEDLRQTSFHGQDKQSCNPTQAGNLEQCREAVNTKLQQFGSAKAAPVISGELPTHEEATFYQRQGKQEFSSNQKTLSSTNGKPSLAPKPTAYCTDLSDRSNQKRDFDLNFFNVYTSSQQKEPVKSGIQNIATGKAKLLESDFPVHDSESAQADFNCPLLPVRQTNFDNESKKTLFVAFDSSSASSSTPATEETLVTS